MTQNKIARQAFMVAGKPIKIMHLPLWVTETAVWLAKTFTSVKTYGSLEFFTTVPSLDMVAPAHGQHTLKTHFETVHKMRLTQTSHSHP